MLLGIATLAFALSPLLLGSVTPLGIFACCFFMAIFLVPRPDREQTRWVVWDYRPTVRRKNRQSRHKTRSAYEYGIEEFPVAIHGVRLPASRYWDALDFYFEQLEKVPVSEMSAEECCAHCRVPYLEQPARPIVRLTCKYRHLFHADCIREWLTAYGKCPFMDPWRQRKPSVVADVPLKTRWFNSSKGCYPEGEKASLRPPRYPGDMNLGVTMLDDGRLVNIKVIRLGDGSEHAVYW